MRSLRPLLVGVLSLGLLSACGGSDSTIPETRDPPPPANAPPEAGTGYSLAYTANTVRLSDALTASAIVSIDSAAHTYRFSASELARAGVSLQSGQVLLIPGTALRRITGANTSGNITTVQTSFASLNEAIRDGTISWDFPLDFAASAVAGAQLQVGDALMAPSLASAAGEVQWEYQAGANTVKAKLTAQGTSAGLEVEVVRRVGTVPKARFTARTTFSDMRSIARMEFEQGRTKEFEYDAKGLGGTVELEVAAAGAGLDELAFDWPEAVIRIPYAVGPIPVIVAIKVQLVTKLIVNGESSATAKTSFTYRGDAGFRYNGTTVSTRHSAGLGTPSIGGTVGDATAFIGNAVDAQFGFAAPKIEVGVFGETLVPFIRPEFFVGTRLQWGPVCKSAYIKYLVQAGIDLRLLGSTLASATDTIVGPVERRESQENCAEGRLLAPASALQLPTLRTPHDPARLSPEKQVKNACDYRSPGDGDNC